MARRRPLAALAAAALVALSCGGDADGTAGGTTAPPAPVVPVPTLPPTVAPGATIAPPPTAPASVPGPTAPGGSPLPPVTGAPPTAPPPGGFPALDADVPVGAFAPALLRADLSERVVVEVQADAPPRQATLDHIAAVLAAASGKPVQVVAGGAPGEGERSWDPDALRAAADAGAASAQGDGTAVLRLLFVRGDLGGDPGVLGVAVRGDVAAVFVDRVTAATGVLGSPAAVEVAVATHEVGHLLGLVDLRLRTGRADPEHPGHSTNRASVMYWAVETDLIGQLLGAAPPNRFDAADEADLAAIRGGA